MIRTCSWTRRTALTPCILVCISVCVSTVSVVCDTAQAQEIQVGPDRRVRVYELESVEVIGTTRLDSEQIATELGLKPGMPLGDETVMTTRSRLLGLGLFKSVILLMRRGSAPGKAKLVIEVEDDDGVLGDYAIGGELSVTASETNAQAVKASNSPLDYRVGLIARNLFNHRHRGSLLFDIDADGKFQQGQLAYGLPRFSLEDIQFDAEIAAASPRTRYLDTLGFGQRAQGLWSQSVSPTVEFAYGAAMYINEGDRFTVPGFPKSVVGPKVEIVKETRLRGFFPGEGHQVGANLLFVPTDSDFSVLELQLAQTLDFSRYLYFTFDARAMLVGSHGYGFRSEARFDIPLGEATPGQDQAEIFLRLRAGQDRIDATDLVGSAAIFGVRYHSSGFIAELALKITRSPDQLTPKTLPTELTEGAGIE